jgi:hypothetical protein
VKERLRNKQNNKHMQKLFQCDTNMLLDNEKLNRKTRLEVLRIKNVCSEKKNNTFMN